MIRVKRHFLELSIKNLSALNLDLQENYTITIDEKKNFNIITTTTMGLMT